MKPLLKLGLLIAAACLAIGVVYETIRGFGNAAAAGGPWADFSGTDLHGNTWSLADHRGKHPVLLSFFATWCGPCAMERPELLELQQKHAARGLQVVLLTKETKAEVGAFPEFANISFTILTDAQAAFDAYAVNPIPHTVLFDEHGEVVENIEGYSPEALRAIDRRLQGMQAVR